MGSLAKLKYGVHYMRETWLDRLKGLLIITVVIGHILPGPYNTLENWPSYIYLFHMPAFFIISGYLIKEKGLGFIPSVGAKAKRTMLPYLIYLFLIAGTQLLMAFIKNPKFYFMKKNLKMFIQGGQDLNYFNCGALWFLTCSFFVFLFFYIIEKGLRNKWLKLVAYLILWIAAHVQSKYFIEGTGPSFLLWDVAIIGCVYLAVGYYLKKYLFDKKVLIGSFTVLIVFVTVRIMGISDYVNGFAIELWSHTYRYPILDMLIPVSGFVILANLMKLIPDGKISDVLSDIGKYTLPIMACHQIILFFLRSIKMEQTLVLWAAGVIIPYLFGKLVINKIGILRKSML